MKSGPALGARLWWGLPVLLVALWAGGALAVTTLPGLPSVTVFTVWLLPILRFTRDVSSMITVGALVVGGLLLITHPTRVRTWAVGWGLAWLSTLVVLFAFTVSDILAIGPGDVPRSSVTWTILTSDTVGRVFLWQFIGVAVAVACAVAGTSTIARWSAAVVALTASAAPAFLGHAGMGQSHTAATISLGLHIAAVSLWVGGLAVTVGVVRLDASMAPTLLPRFSMLALGCVLVVAETGLLNASLRAGAASAMVGTSYGALCLAKAVILGWLVRLGWLQRRRALPQLTATGTASSVTLLRLASTEFVLMGAALALSVAMSRIGPSIVLPSGDGFTPLALVVLTLAAPILVISCLRPSSNGGFAAWVSRYPEVWAVIMLIVVIEVGGVAVFTAFVGREPAAVLGSLTLVGAGTLWALSVAAAGSQSGVVVAMVGWPIAMIVVARLADTQLGWQAWLAALAVAEGMLALALRGLRREASSNSEDESVVTSVVTHG